VASAVIAAALHGVAGHVGGWALSSVVAFSLVTVQRRSAARRQAELQVVEARWVARVAFLVVVAGMVVSGVHAWGAAWEIATKVHT